MKQPNILYIHSHDTGRYIQPYGHAIPTPHLQRLAEQGVLFRQNFCINPTCSASRAALLVGNYPHENGMTGLAHRGWCLNDYGQHLVHTLKGQGYTTVQIGVQHVAANTDEKPGWKTIGYDRNMAGGENGAAAFLADAPPEPFFLAVGFGQTHRNFPPLEKCCGDPRYCLPPAVLPDTPETRQDMVRFAESARSLDEKMGVVFDALEENGLADNTLVVCTTDHGIAFPRMKCNLQDSGTGVMLIMRGPGGFTGGKVIDSMVNHLDIFPTLCDMLDIEAPAWTRGSSLLPLVNDEVEDLHEELFFEVNYHASYEPMRAVRTKRWKYIKRFDGRTTPVLPNCDDGESKSVWLAHGWPEQPVAEESLFDLVFDPNETNNLAQCPVHKPVLDELRQRLDGWMKETRDPLLTGPVPAPPDAVVNDADSLSCREPSATIREAMPAHAKGK